LLRYLLVLTLFFGGALPVYAADPEAPLAIEAIARGDYAHFGHNA
jgi:hypothetical protein